MLSTINDNKSLSGNNLEKQQPFRFRASEEGFVLVSSPAYVWKSTAYLGEATGTNIPFSGAFCGWQDFGYTTYQLKHCKTAFHSIYAALHTLFLNLQLFAANVTGDQPRSSAVFFITSGFLKEAYCDPFPQHEHKRHFFHRWLSRGLKFF